MSRFLTECVISFGVPEGVARTAVRAHWGLAEEAEFHYFDRTVLLPEVHLDWDELQALRVALDPLPQRAVEASVLYIVLEPNLPDRLDGLIEEVVASMRAGFVPAVCRPSASVPVLD